MSGRDERPIRPAAIDRVSRDIERVYTFLERVDGLDGTRTLEFLRAIAMLAGIQGSVQHRDLVARKVQYMLLRRERERNVR